MGTENRVSRARVDDAVEFLGKMEGPAVHRWEYSLQKDLPESFSRLQTVIELCCCSSNCRTATLRWERRLGPS
jgi:hypothetical protein